MPKCFISLLLVLVKAMKNVDSFDLQQTLQLHKGCHSVEQGFSTFLRTRSSKMFKKKNFHVPAVKNKHALKCWIALNGAGC